VSPDEHNRNLLLDRAATTDDGAVEAVARSVKYRWEPNVRKLRRSTRRHARVALPETCIPNR
jgi:hypothetical protein